MEIKLKNRIIGPGHPVFIVADMSANHHQSLATAQKIIDAAQAAGADAIKLQTYTPDTMTIDSDKEYFQIKVNNAWAGQTLYQLYQKAFTPWDWHPELKKSAEEKGLIFFATPFDSSAVDLLEKLDVPLYKIASFEIVDLPLLKRIGQTKKPVIISRGMASVAEIKLAIKTLKKHGTTQVAVLHCVSSYPAKVEEMNLATIPDIFKKFKVITGLSDHSLSTDLPLVAVGLGASIIEKHLTLKRAEGGPDAGFSLELSEFKLMVDAIRKIEKALGRPSYQPGEKEAENIIFRKSLFVVKPLKTGERFTTDNVRSIRPGQGLAPKYFDQVMGKTAAVDIEAGTPLNWDLIK